MKTGKVSVVGIGPGNYENMTIRADRCLRECDVIIGYSVYVDLVRDLYPDKEFAQTGMTREKERCEMAVSMAREGKKVAMVCSGDSSVYGMAALVYEVRNDMETPEIEVIPGLTAALTGSALLGAALTHDFAVISLSDRLTDWETITKRLKAAASADLSIVLYNPVSKGRPDHLFKACEILLGVLPEERVCAVARKIGREGESCFVMTLKEMKDFPADMFCTVFIGNAKTKVVGGKMITPRGYRGV